MEPSEPIACTLSADNYPIRLAGLAEIRGEDVPRVRELTNGVEMSFTDSPQMRDKLEGFVTAESECCSFMLFQLEPDGSQIVLTVTAAPEGLPIVEELASAFMTGTVNR